MTALELQLPHRQGSNLSADWRLPAFEKLETAEKLRVLQLIDAFIERGQLRRRAESRA